MSLHWRNGHWEWDWAGAAVQGIFGLIAGAMIGLLLYFELFPGFPWIIPIGAVVVALLAAMFGDRAWHWLKWFSG